MRKLRGASGESLMSNIRLSPNFHRSEFACPVSGIATVDHELLTVLEAVREYFEEPVIVTSGFRSEEYNRKIGGAPSSYHLIGQAADIRILGVGPKTIVKLLRKWYPHKYGIGEYPAHVHVDIRDEPVTWIAGAG